MCSSIGKRKKALQCYIEPVLMHGVDNVKSNTKEVGDSGNVVLEKGVV